MTDPATLLTLLPAAISGAGSLGNLFGGGGSPQYNENVQQGPFTFGPTPFELGIDQTALNNSLGQLAARYNQLGMGGSTPATMDARATGLARNALIGQQQTAEVGQQAFNPALQTPVQTPVSNTNPTNPAQAGAGLGSLAALFGNQQAQNTTADQTSSLASELSGGILE